MFLLHPLVKLSIVGSLRDREVAYSASDLQDLNFESCVWRAVSSHHPQEVLLAQFSLYVHKSGLKPDSFNLIPPSPLCIPFHPPLSPPSPFFPLPISSLSPFPYFSYCLLIYLFFFFSPTHFHVTLSLLLLIF